MRNILLDIDKFIEQGDLVNDDAFWRSFIQKVTQTQKVEPLLWDCKETLTMWHLEKNPERDQAKVTFCEDVASFANARGGVLVVGVTDKREIVGIGSGHELENRLKFASDVLAAHLDYPRNITRLRQVAVKGKDGTDKVCLVVVVAQACEPVGVRDGAGRYTFPVRRETGLTRVSREEIFNPKMHIKSDSYEFLRELYQFVHEK
jgi:predicted HTH transcriptional regulator